MTPEQFWRKANEWADRLRVEPKSRCLFAFDERGLVRDEEHRAACIHVLSVVALAVAMRVDARQDYLADPEQTEVREMIDYVKIAKIMPPIYQIDRAIRSYNSTAGHLRRK